MNTMLRNYIPISGPATREPCRGGEPLLRLSLGFCPRWFRERLGIDFSSRWHHDPLYRYGTLYQMKKHLNKTFPDVPEFWLDEKNGFESRCATISGVFGIKLIPMLYGLRVQYRQDDWPDNLPHDYLSKETLAALEPFDLSQLEPIDDLLSQMDMIRHHFGPIDGYLNYQGILNIALKLRGNELFLDLYDDPPFVHHLFEHIANTIDQTAHLVQSIQRDSGFDVDLLSMSNCVMNMVSPETYQSFVLPRDLHLSERFNRFGIHTCNWDATPFLDVLRKIPKMGYLDMGMMSDMKKARELFPDARRAVLYSPVALTDKDKMSIKDDLLRIKYELAPCDLVMADVSPGTDDDRIKMLIDLLAEANKV